MDVENKLKQEQDKTSAHEATIAMLQKKIEEMQKREDQLVE